MIFVLHECRSVFSNCVSRFHVSQPDFFFKLSFNVVSGQDLTRQLWYTLFGRFNKNCNNNIDYYDKPMYVMN